MSACVPWEERKLGVAYSRHEPRLEAAIWRARTNAGSCDLAGLRFDPLRQAWPHLLNAKMALGRVGPAREKEVADA